MMTPMSKETLQMLILLKEEITEAVTEVILIRSILTMGTTEAIPEGITEVIQDRTSRNRYMTGIGMIILMHVSSVINWVTLRNFAIIKEISSVTDK